MLLAARALPACLLPPAWCRLLSAARLVAPRVSRGQSHKQLRTLSIAVRIEV